MTLEQWAQSTLSFDSHGDIVLETHANGGYIGCPIGTFVSLASAITTVPPTYAELSSLPISNMGWQQYFDDWRSKGIIS